MLCTCIYFADIGSFNGKNTLTPSNDLGVDADDDQDMVDVEDHEVGADKPAPASAPVPPFARRSRPDSRFRLELGDQLCAFFVEVGVRPATMRDIRADGRLVHMWRGMPRDMYNLMRHVVGATTLVTQLRRTVASYRRGRDATLDRQSASSDTSFDDLSPHVMLDEQPPLASSNNHHREQAGPSATSS